MEWRRVFTDKKLLLLSLLLLLATAGIYLYEQNRVAEEWGYSLADKLDYQEEVSKKIIKMSLDDADKWLTKEKEAIQEQGMLNLEAGEYDVRLDYQEQVLSEEQMQIEYLLNYPEYLANILEDSQKLSSISIFKNSDSFASQNLERTREDYEGLRDIEVSYGTYDGLTTVMDYDVVHYSILIFAFLLVWSFFEDEKKGLKCIFYATSGGRSKLALQRISVLAGGVGLFTLLVYFLLFLSSFCLYGGIEDVKNSIQSVEMFQTCTLSLSVLGYMFYFVFMHMIISIVMSLVIWMILSIWRNRFIATAVLLLIIAGETVLCHSLKEQSAIAFFKYENLYFMINPVEMLGTYRNYAVFGQLANCFTSFGIMVIMLAVLCVATCVGISVRRKTIASAGKVELVLKHFLRKVSACYHKIIAELPLMGMELYKVLITKKGICFLGIWCYLLFSMVDTTEKLSIGSSAMMQEVYAEYSGPDDGKLRYYFLEPKQKILELVEQQYEAALADYETGRVTEEEMNKISMRYQSYDGLRNTVNSTQSQLAYMERVKSETGIRVWFMYQKGYKIMLTGDGLYEGAGYGNQEKYALYAVVLMVLLLSGVFSYDRSCGMEKMLYATPYGRNRLFHIKIGMAAFLCFTICVITYGLELYEIQNNYPLTSLEAPVQSLTFMEKFPLEISIGVFLVWLETIHFLALFAISMMVYCISIYFQELKGLLAGLLILVLPTVMYLLGIKWCSYISVTQPVIFVESLQEHGFVYSVITLLIELIIGGICYGLVKRKWCNQTQARRRKK